MRRSDHRGLPAHAPTDRTVAALTRRMESTMESPDTLVAVKEYCRHWVDGKANNCHAPAVVIVWGKLAAPDEFGPRCAAHLPRWLDMHRIDQYAVFDLRGVVGRAADRQET